MVSKTEKAVNNVIEEVLVYLQKCGYAENTIAQHQACWRSFLQYARKQRESRYTQSLVDGFLDSLPVTCDCERARRKRFAHFMRILSEFTAFGHHRRRASVSPPVLPSFMEVGLTSLAKFAEQELGWAERTIASRLRWMRRFLLFLLDQRDIQTWNDISATDLPAYIKSTKGFRRNTISTAVGAITSGLRVLFVQGTLSKPLHEQVPPMFTPRDAILPTIWQPSEVTAVLNSVDRSTALGKRDYCILLLALRLGLRPCDIRALRLDDIRWERSTIKLIQQKTSVSLQLPLSAEIGDALVDYLRSGRPNTNHREIFLCNQAPYNPFAKGSPLYEVVQRYRKKAGLPRKPRMGLTSFRHTLATRLLEGGTALETISDILGHTSVETTYHYLSVDLSSLRQAALDPEEEVSHE